MNSSSKPAWPVHCAKISAKILPKKRPFTHCTLCKFRNSSLIDRVLFQGNIFVTMFLMGLVEGPGCVGAVLLGTIHKRRRYFLFLFRHPPTQRLQFLCLFVSAAKWTPPTQPELTQIFDPENRLKSPPWHLCLSFKKPLSNFWETFEHVLGNDLSNFNLLTPPINCQCILWMTHLSWQIWKKVDTFWNVGN